jgi:DNA-binding transcriptional ArsR family regulator
MADTRRKEILTGPDSFSLQTVCQTVVKILKAHTHSAALVWFTLLERLGGGRDVCWPSWATLQKDTGLSRRAVVYALRELEEAGLVVTTRNFRRQVNGYELLPLTSAKECTPPVQRSAPLPVQSVAPGTKRKKNGAEGQRNETNVAPSRGSETPGADREAQQYGQGLPSITPTATPEGTAAAVASILAGWAEAELPVSANSRADLMKLVPPFLEEKGLSPTAFTLYFNEQILPRLLDRASSRPFFAHKGTRKPLGPGWLFLADAEGDYHIAMVDQGDYGGELPPPPPPTPEEMAKEAAAWEAKYAADGEALSREADVERARKFKALGITLSAEEEALLDQHEAEKPAEGEAA